MMKQKDFGGKLGGENMLKNKLFLITLGLIILGVLTVYSTTSVHCFLYYGDKLFLFKRHIIYTGIGIFLMLFFSKINYDIYRKYSYWILIVSIILLSLTLVPGINYVAGGAKRWIQFFGITFRPSELVKIAIIIIFAYLLSKEITINNILVIIISLAIISIILLYQPDFGTSIIIFLTFFTILLSSKIQKKNVIIFYVLPVIFLIFLYFIYSEPYHSYSISYRIKTFLNPLSDVNNESYQTLQSLIAIGSNGILGTGYTRSIQKWGYLPGAHTDFSFAIFCEELGIIGEAFLFLLYLGFLNQGIKIANNTSDNFAKLLVIGIISQILWQTVINIASVTNTIPLISTSLPFISYSGSSIVFTLIGIGILLNVDHSFKNLSEVENEK